MSVTVAIASDVPVYLDEIGRCVAYEMVSVQPQVSGQITAIHFADGADLKRGDQLFTIDPRTYETQLQSAEADLVRAQASLELARIEFERVAGLVESKAVSQQDYDVRKNEVQVGEALVQERAAAVERAKINLDYCHLRSPIDGRAGHRLVDVGNVVNAAGGMAAGSALVTIQRVDPMYADFTITENDLTAVQRSMAQKALSVEIRLPDEEDRPLTGDLTFLDNAVQDATGTVKLRATIANPDRRLWPGRFVRVRLVLQTLQGAVLVPADAPQLSANGPFVYVVKGDTAELRPIQTGQRQGDLIVIERGVKAGEKVVVAGQIGVMPGGKVQVPVVPPAAILPPRDQGSKP